MRITALAGGVGGARFLRGLRAHLDSLDGGPHELTVIANTGDDITLSGLRVCPDVDTLLYTLGGGANEAQGWGRAEETFTVQGELTAYGVGPDWFGLGDKDFGTHIARNYWRGQGLSYSQIIERLAARWGLPEQHVRLLPMTDEPVETHVIVDRDGEQEAIHFQHWWVKERAAIPAQRFVVAGLDRANPAPGVLEAIRTADLIVLPPSNPVVSIGIVLLVPGVRDALRGTTAPVVGVSPIVGGGPVRGHADACLAALDVEVSPQGVASLYADFLDGWLVAPGEGATAEGATAEGAGGYPRDLVVQEAPLLMSSPEAATAMAAATLRLAEAVRR
ncbi:2-phospho-L-lactate transferase [Calidifontibacter sp. DB0510]|uniref:2-phospho-L-lactate transferase n=1 Tax=Metallococcus carri TaxID=1656884 RepID=A0A967AY56_9MICO|nr:2-phospho-L-lactate transferase [Metallococcus carri]NHN54579.1 2-phospho-L-lactate transferase [Metallococcus carri]NOP36582.1 2-phospho-L-lactate transferase [Calidifontibacter sp. DB2511S]